VLCILLWTVKACCTCLASVIFAYKPWVTSTNAQIAIFLHRSRIFRTRLAIIAIGRRIGRPDCSSWAFRTCSGATQSLKLAQFTLHTRASERSCKPSVTLAIAVFCVDSTARSVGRTCNTHSSCCVRVVRSFRARRALCIARQVFVSARSTCIARLSSGKKPCVAAAVSNRSGSRKTVVDTLLTPCLFAYPKLSCSTRYTRLVAVDTSMNSTSL